MYWLFYFENVANSFELGFAVLLKYFSLKMKTTTKY